MNRNIERNRVTALIQRAEIAGFAMPEAVLAAIRKEEGLRADLVKTREESAHIPTASDFVSELRANGGLPADFGKRLRMWQEKTLMLKEQNRLLELAVEEQQEGVYLATSREARQIITAQLQPCLAAILDAVRKHAAAYPDVPDVEAAMRLDDQVQKDAYFAVKAATARYMALREALGLLYDGQQLEIRHEIRNLREIWPNFQFRSAGNKPPWPSDREKRLVWLVTHNADLWAPTPEEADVDELQQLAATRAKSGYPGNAAIGVRGPE